MAESFSPLRWGILGAGSIAKRFSGDVRKLPDHKLQAVGSRDQAKADTFADSFDIPTRHNSYEALVNDPDVDVIYVATPHNFHKEHSILALEAGKPVLCEKPFTINNAEAQAVVDVAKAKGIFLMEGMWSRFFPAMAKARELAKSGIIGEPRLLEADFGFRGGKMGDDGKLEITNPNGRLYNPDLGGGALMDVGVYPVSLAEMFFGPPDKVTALGTLGTTGVDENTGMLMHFPGGQMGILHTALQVSTAQKLTLLGTEGRIEIPTQWWKPQYVLVQKGGQTERFDFPVEGEGFHYEAAHVAECLRAGKTESDIVTFEDTLAVMGALDDMRAALGIKYPME